jgi:hypothetical protein
MGPILGMYSGEKRDFVGRHGADKAVLALSERIAM